MNTREHPFVVGQVYNRRRDIHGHFAGQERGGISTPTSLPLIFAFTSEAGTAYGYEDTFKPDGTFWYTGEGQVGDMRMIRGNAAIAHHAHDGKKVLLYESTPSDQVRFLGEVEYLGHHTEQRPDRNADQRDAIIFHLGFLPPVFLNAAEQPRKAYATTGRLSTKLSLAELRAIALESVSADATVEQKRANLARRAEAIKRYAILRANGACEACNQAAPFRAKSGPFLEVHHVFRLADGGPDHPANVVALCPNCHRRSHFSLDAEQFNEGLIAWLATREAT
jgi:5-methylcytosine-specific restriction protein A